MRHYWLEFRNLFTGNPLDTMSACSWTYERETAAGTVGRSAGRNLLDVQVDLGAFSANQAPYMDVEMTRPTSAPGPRARPVPTPWSRWAHRVSSHLGRVTDTKMDSR